MLIQLCVIFQHHTRLVKYCLNIYLLTWDSCWVVRKLISSFLMGIFSPSFKATPASLSKRSKTGLIARWLGYPWNLCACSVGGMFPFEHLLWIWNCIISQQCVFNPVGCGCRIHQLHLYRGVRLPVIECSGYDTKPFGEYGVSLHCHYSLVYSDPCW